MFPYCPNCRRPLPEGISEDAAAWICTRAKYAKDLFEGDERSRVLGEAEAIFRSDSLYVGQPEVDICHTLNGPSVVTCIGCGSSKDEQSYKVACSSCGYEIPRLSGALPHSVTITGPGNAGKSHYVVALHEWMRLNLATFGLTLLPEMDRRVRSLFESFRARVAANNVLSATGPGEATCFTWRIHASDGRPGIILTLPDGSGERLKDPVHLDRTRHYHHTSAVVMLLDGARIAKAVGLFEDSRDPNEHHEVITAMLTDFYRRLRGKHHGIPIAACINKIDVLASLDQRWAQVCTGLNEVSDGELDFEAWEARSQEIRRLLVSHPRTRSIVHALEAEFERVMYFVMATLGAPPESGVVRGRITPVGVGDPLLWIMWNLGLV